MNTNEILDLEIGAKVTADFIANISGLNKVEGIHFIKEDGTIKGVGILCTLNGETYNNEWMVQGKVLKYYLKGIKNRDGIKVFKETYLANRSIIDSKNKYDINVFIRNKKGEKFKYIGKFELNTVVTEDDGAKYFILTKRDATEQLPPETGSSKAISVKKTGDNKR